MKIPIYRRQTPLPTKTSGQYLGSSADPGKFGMVAGAYAQLGVNVMNEGLNWFGTQLKQVRATKLATADAEFTSHLTQAAHNSKYQNVQSKYWKNEAGETLGLHDQRARVEQSLLAQAQAQASNISDPVVRRRFLTNTTSSVASAMPQIMTNLTTSWQQYSEGEYDKHSKLKVFEIAQIDNDETRTLRVEQRLKEIADYGMANVWDANDINKEQQSFLEDLDVYRIGRRVSEAVELKDPDLLEDLLQELRTGVNDAGQPVYEHLSLDRRDKTITRIEARADRLVTAKHNAEMKAARDEEWQVTNRQKINYESISASIDKARAWQLKNPGVSLSEAPDEITMPTRDEILEMGENREINPNQKTVLLRQFDGNDKLNNPHAVADFSSRITNAFTEEDLRYLESEVERQYQAGIIGGMAHKNLIAKIKGVRGKTPRGAQDKRFERSLRAVMGESVNMFRIPGISADDTTIEREAALRDYHARVGEGMRPAQAFYEVLDAHLTLQPNEIKVAEGIVRSLPRGIAQELGITDIRNFDITTLTMEDIKRARTMWEIHASGRLPKDVVALEKERGVASGFGQLSPEEVRDLGLDMKQRIGVRDLYAAENSLQYLGNVVNRYGGQDKPDIVLEEPPLEETETNANGEEQQTQESVEEDNQYLKRILDMLNSFRDNKPQSALEEGRNRGSGR